MNKLKDKNGKVIKVGDTLCWLKNTLNVTKYEKWTAVVKYSKKHGCLYTDSPYKEAFRPIESKHQDQIEVVG